LSRDHGVSSSRIGLISKWVLTIPEKNIYFIFQNITHALNKKSGLIVGQVLFLKSLVQHDQGGGRWNLPSGSSRSSSS
jgi:hypothetical protein